MELSPAVALRRTEQMLAQCGASIGVSAKTYDEPEQLLCVAQICMT